MTDNERATRRTEVRAFRSVARWLTDPTAGLLADLVRAEEWLNLTSTLPLVDVDLFAAVPDVVRRGTSTTTSGTVRARPGNTVGLPPLSRQAHSVSHPGAPQPTVTSDGSEVLQQAPVFSFRQREMPRAVRHDGPWPLAAPNPVPNRPLPPAAPAQGHNSPANMSIQRSVGLDEARGETSAYAGRSRPALTQLAQVAEKVAQQLHPPHPPEVSPARASMPEPRALSRLERLLHSALRLTSLAGGTPVSREDPAGSDVHDTRPEPWAPLSVREHAPAGAESVGSDQNSLQHVMHLIKSHVDRLLSPDMAMQLSSAGADIRSNLAGALGAEHSAAHPPEHAPALPGHAGEPGLAEYGTGYPPGYTGHASVAPLAETGAGRVGVAPRPPMPAGALSLTENTGAWPADAASLTALVNEVLVEQARRHGVDLS